MQWSVQKLNDKYAEVNTLWEIFYKISVIIPLTPLKILKQYKKSLTICQSVSNDTDTIQFDITENKDNLQVSKSHKFSSVKYIRQINSNQ